MRTYFPASKGLVGSHAEAFVHSLKADVCIIGAGGVSVDAGITTPYPMHTALQKAIISSAMTWKDSTYFAPEALVDGKKRQIVWSWLRDNLHNDFNRFGWSGVFIHKPPTTEGKRCRRAAESALLYYTVMPPSI